VPETRQTSRPNWWRGAVIYEVYLRSFADGNGDGVGDLAGLRSRLPYLADLGVDAIWVSPWFPSPMADAGYDVADYRDIDPLFGTLAEAEAVIAAAHARQLRVIIDLVPNHCSTAHAWFTEALAAEPGAAARDLFWFRPGRGPDGDLPPNDWESIFGGPAWHRATTVDGAPGEWYLHLFAPEQPDFNWSNPKVREEFEDILRFWFDRGVDGIRIDSAALLVKDPVLADFDPAADLPPGTHPYTDRDGVHEIYRGWRAVADSYPGERALIGEIWLPDPERFTRYLRPDEMHSAFNFPFLESAWDADRLRAVIDSTIEILGRVGAPPSWVLSNHDVTRPVTRYGRADTSWTLTHRQHGAPTDLALGLRRARAAALLSAALPGGVYLYQGEELGLPEVEDIPDDLLQDPFWIRSGRTNPGRDGCRVPLPWAGAAPPFGFSPAGAAGQPWLPQPAGWAGATMAAQQADPGSVLNLYRAALRLRRAEPALGDGGLCWLPAPAGVLAFRRPATAGGAGVTCVVNLSEVAAPLPPNAGLLLASVPLLGAALPPDAACWLRTA
jgi:alpha-glucosidase